MKIIGQSVDGLLLSASEDEVANLCGFYSAYDDKYTRTKVGDKICVAEMFHRLYDIEHNRKTLNQTAAKLRVIADMLEVVQPIVSDMDKAQIEGT